jgi:hypothetical protein
MDDVAFILYTHTDCKDVCKPFFSETEKFMCPIKKYIFVNEKFDEIPADYEVVLYDDSKIYRERIGSCLQKINEGYLILSHEDMFLYDKPDLKRIAKYKDYLESSDKSFVRLIRGGKNEGTPNSKISELKEIDSSFQYVFAIQPTLWKTDDFLEITEKSKGNTIWEFEVKASTACKQFNKFGYYVDDSTPKRGSLHWDSKVFPYIATAVVKGKWNTKEYGKELAKIFEEYEIDPQKRGVNK